MKLLERETPLRELEAALKESTAGEGRVALVSGEAGIGKTSLVEQFVRERPNSVRVLWGACDSLFTPRPLGPLHDMAMQSKGDLPKLAAPARRALAEAGITRLVQLTQMSEADLAQLHGIGPNAIETLRIALKEKGLSFLSEKK